MKRVGDGGLVGLDLLEGGMNGRVFVGGVLQLDHDQGQAVDEEQHVGALVDAVFDDGELVDDQVIVVFGLGEIHQPDEIAARAAVFLVGDRDAFRQQAVESLVVGDQVGGVEALDLAQGVKAGGGRNLGVETGDRRFQACQEEDVFKAAPFGHAAVWRYVGAVEVAVPSVLQAFDSQQLDIVFCDIHGLI